MVKIRIGPQHTQDIKTINIRTICFYPTELTINLYYWNNQKETIKFDNKKYCRAAYKKLCKYIAYPF